MCGPSYRVGLLMDCAGPHLVMVHLHAQLSVLLTPAVLQDITPLRVGACTLGGREADGCRHAAGGLSWCDVIGSKQEAQAGGGHGLAPPPLYTIQDLLYCINSRLQLLLVGARLACTRRVSELPFSLRPCRP